MNIIVDTNIIFSAIINSNGKIGNILFNSYNDLVLYSPEFMRYEIQHYHDKLMKAAKLTEQQLLEAEYRIISQIELISEELIKKSSWEYAYELTKDIDEDDTPFVALTIELNGLLWTGDKKLIKGLKNKGWNSAYSTSDMMGLRYQ
jgi:predicted nucleic acid-binding protein